MSKGKKNIYDSEDPAYTPDLGFLRDIYVSAQQNPDVDSHSLDALVSFCSDTFTSRHQASMEEASLDLSLCQHSTMMALV
ncbi:hypothetical protein MKW92_013799, partial [Papaver armeniacum]